MKLYYTIKHLIERVIAQVVSAMRGVSAAVRGESRDSGGRIRHRAVRSSCVAVGALVLLFGLLAACDDSAPANGGSGGDGGNNTIVDATCADNSAVSEADGDCDGDGVANGADAYDRNACAALDTDGDSFPDLVAIPMANQACDDAEAAALVAILNGEATAADKIAGCATDAFAMCADGDDNDNGIPDDIDILQMACADNILVTAATADCDGDGVLNGADAYPMNACAALDTDGDTFPDTVATPTAGQACDDDEATALVTILNSEAAAADKIAGCAADAFTMCADGDDDGDNTPDVTDAYPLNACAALDTDGDRFPDIVATPIANQACDDDEATALVVILNAEALAADTIAGCAADAFTLCADSDDDGDGTPDDAQIMTCTAGDALTMPNGDCDGDGVTNGADAYPLNACAAADSDGDGHPDAVSTVGIPATCTVERHSALTADNCPTNANADQVNSDGDTEGDTCDVDDDNDLIADSTDAFPLNACAGVDSDGDNFPDAVAIPTVGQPCDDDEAAALVAILNGEALAADKIAGCAADAFALCADSDNDGDNTPDVTDAYPLNACAALDTDGDRFPDIVATPIANQACDDDEAAALVVILNAEALAADKIAGCAADAFTLCADSDDDGDGTPDDAQIMTCTADDALTMPNGDCDGDGVTNGADAYPLNACAAADSDSDGHPDAVSTVGIPATCTVERHSALTADNCPTNANADQVNNDGDTEGDTCDVDDDNDLVADSTGRIPTECLCRSGWRWRWTPRHAGG